MDDLELELRRSLHDTAHDLRPAADPVSAVGAGMRRRARRRIAGSAGAAAVAVVAIVLTTTQLGDRRDGLVHPVEPATSQPAAVTSPAPSSPASQPPSSPAATPTPTTLASSSAGVASVAPSAAPSASPAVEQPQAFTDVAGVDVSFISANVGWAVVRAMCNGSPCKIVLKTTNGARTWVQEKDIARPLPVELACAPQPDVFMDCPVSLRFANANIGYALVSRTLWVGDGRNWSSIDTTPVFAVEPAGGDVIRIVSTTNGCPPGCPFFVQTAAVGSSTWTTLKTPPLQGVGARLLRHGDDVYVFAYHNQAGGVEAHTTIVVSHDRGASWTRRADPCSPVDSKPQEEIDAVDAAIGVDGTFVMLCKRRLSTPGNDNDTLRVSTDSATTFGAALPFFGSANRVAVGDATHIVVSAASGSSVQLLLSTDGGHRFASVLTTERANQQTDRFLAFTTAAVGTWIDGAGKLWRTSDGGATWQQRSVG